MAARELEAEAREEAAELRRAAERASAKQTELQKENERLVQRLLEAQLSMAQAVDSRCRRPTSGSAGTPRHRFAAAGSIISVAAAAEG